MNLRSLDFEKPVWRVLPDHAGPGLAVEIRSREDKFVQFFYLSLLDRKPTEITHGQDWWKGLEAVHNSHIILHAYESPGLPLHQGLYVYEGVQGKLLWEKPQAIFEALAEDIISAKDKTGTNTHYRLSSGEVSAKTPTKSNFDQDAQKKQQDLSFPKVLIDGQAEFLSYQSVIKTHWKLKALLHIDLFQGTEKLADYEVLNFYHKNTAGTWNQELGIFKDRQLVFQCQTGKNLRGLSLDPFFIFQHYLIWTEGGTRLSYLRLG